jgi:hypothetical protein
LHYCIIALLTRTEIFSGYGMSKYERQSEKQACTTHAPKDRYQTLTGHCFSGLPNGSLGRQYAFAATYVILGGPPRWWSFFALLPADYIFIVI